MVKKSTIISENEDTPNSPKHRHYVDNNKFYEALCERKRHIDAGEPVPKRIEDYIGECIMLIAENVGKRHNFARYSWRDEMVGDAIVQCTRAIDKFDVEKYQNPLAYFTQCTVYAFLGRMEREQNQVYTKYKSMIEAATFGKLDSADDEDSAHILDNLDVSMEYMIDFIEGYEEKQQKKKQKKNTDKGKGNTNDVTQVYGEDDETKDDG